MGLLASALPAAAAASNCRDEPDDARRLACYDASFGRSVVPAASLAADPKPALKQESPVETAGHLSERWDLDKQVTPLFAPRAYRPVYMLPVSWADEANQMPQSPNPTNVVGQSLEVQKHEAKYQLSLKSKLAHRVFGAPISLWGGYTQSSRWQIYNGGLSRPFRETNYEPELIATTPLKGSVFGWQVRYAALALNHQSNGRALPLSRSWNRVIGTVGLEKGDWVVELRPWVRLSEDNVNDDNPDVLDYIGRGELRVGRYSGDHAWHLNVRHSLRSGERSRGSAQMDWAFPITGVLHGFLQVFHGYGESLIDYNRAQTRVGLGVTIAGWR